MRKREKLTPEERFALALALIKRERSLQQICHYYQVSHTTAYKVRNAFLDGGRRALGGARARQADLDGEEGTAELAGPVHLAVPDDVPARECKKGGAGA
jgi:transposase-like protein